MTAPMTARSDIVLVASGDLRESANTMCWPAQAEMERALTEAITDVGADLGARVTRGHPVDPNTGHGFIASQREGIEVFRHIDPTAPLIVAEAVWQYSQNILAGLIAHEGPILTVANWSGTWPGLVGLLNLNGSLIKAGVEFSSLWSVDFKDDWFRTHLRGWLTTGCICHDLRHLHRFQPAAVPAKLARVATAIATDLRDRRTIMGIFDEGCMGMYNAIIPDELLFPLGVFKERLSQSTLYHETTQVSEAEARAVYDWICATGFTFHLGQNEATELTLGQVLDQCRMYIAAARLAQRFGCEAIGIQYQQGLKDLLPASDLAEGLLNNDERPPVTDDGGDATGQVIRAGRAIVHFNEVDECAGLDGILTNRVHRALGQPVETTLHDLRWGDFDASGSTDAFVWVLEISGAVPAAHNIGGYMGSDSVRQPPMFFRKGGGTLRGVAHPGEIVWSRIFVEGGRLCMDIGRASVIALPDEETERRWHLTNREWPIMHAVLHGVSRDQMMARHRANHIQVAYANSAADADAAMLTKAALADDLGLEVTICGARPADRDLKPQIIGQRGFCQHRGIGVGGAVGIGHLNMVGPMAGHHLIAADTVQHRVHDRPFAVGQMPAALGFLIRQGDHAGAADVHAQPPTLDKNARPDDFTGMGHAAQGAASFAKKHRRLAHAVRAHVATDIMRRRHRARNFQHPDKGIGAARGVKIAPAQIVKRGFHRLAQRPVHPVGEDAIKARAFIHLVEMDDRPASTDHLPGCVAPIIGNRRALVIVEQPLGQIRSGQKILEPLLILDADRLATKPLREARGGDIHPALIKHLAQGQLGRLVLAQMKGKAGGADPVVNGAGLGLGHLGGFVIEGGLRQTFLEHPKREQKFIRNDGVIHAHAAFVENAHDGAPVTQIGGDGGCHTRQLGRHGGGLKPVQVAQIMANAPRREPPAQMGAEPIILEIDAPKAGEFHPSLDQRAIEIEQPHQPRPGARPVRNRQDRPLVGNQTGQNVLRILPHGLGHDQGGGGVYMTKNLDSLTLAGDEPVARVRVHRMAARDAGAQIGPHIGNGLGQSAFHFRLGGPAHGVGAFAQIAAGHKNDIGSGCHGGCHGGIPLL